MVTKIKKIDSDSAIAERLKLLRGDLTMEQLGNRLDVDKSQISQYEKAKKKPASGFLQKLVERLKVNINWLLTGEGEMYLEKTKLTNPQKIYKSTSHNITFDAKLVDDHREYDIPGLKEDDVLYRVVANDNAMAPDIVKGDQITFLVTEKAKDGDMVIVTENREGDWLVRNYKKHGDTVVLIPKNGDFERLTWKSGYRVAGVVVKVTSNKYIRGR